MTGAGKYDDVCSQAREASDAKSIILMVIDGSRGCGFSIQSTDPMFCLHVPELLRKTAQLVEDDLKPKPK